MMNQPPTDSTTTLPTTSNTASSEFIGRWHNLISTTNWDKGRIIAEWREALVDAGMPPAEFSDEAWSNLVGNVTAQHVGRLRRVYQRFGADRVSFEGLYWSHFCAALDWDDAEMWLEGAIQNDWSVSKMRRQRWETLGRIPAEEPQAGDIVVTEPEEERIVGPSDFDEEEEDLPPELRLDGQPVVVEDHQPESVDNSTERAPQKHAADDDSAVIYAGDQNTLSKFVQPFEDLTDLPEDLTTAFEQFKQVILHHKRLGWDRVSQADVLASLESLKSLVVRA